MIVRSRVSNGWSVDIGFDAQAVSSAVSFDVELSWAEQMSASYPVPAGHCGHIVREDTFRIVDFWAYTLWIYFGPQTGYGSAQEFLYPYFEGSDWPA